MILIEIKKEIMTIRQKNKITKILKEKGKMLLSILH